MNIIEYPGFIDLNTKVYPLTAKEFEALDQLSEHFELAFNALPNEIKLAYFNWLMGTWQS